MSSDQLNCASKQVREGNEEKEIMIETEGKDTVSRDTNAALNDLLRLILDLGLSTLNYTRCNIMTSARVLSHRLRTLFVVSSFVGCEQLPHQVPA